MELGMIMMEGKKMEDGVWLNWCLDREQGFPKSPEREVAPGDKK